MDLSGKDKFCKRCGIKLTVENCYYTTSDLLCKKHYNQVKNARQRAKGWPNRRKYEVKHEKTPIRKRQKAETAKRMMEKYPEKFDARYRARRAVQKGIIKKKPCAVCGEEKVEGHHPDYSKPLYIVWLCKRHHVDTHFVR